MKQSPGDFIDKGAKAIKQMDPYVKGKNKPKVGNSLPHPKSGPMMLSDPIKGLENKVQHTFSKDG